MAEPDHLERLNDLAAWNAWRRESGEQPDLTGADLSGVDLSEADLQHAKLSMADLSDACLVNATLPYTDLSGADLTEADLRGAQLWGADLSGSAMIGADLASANLRTCDLSDADLTSSNLAEASLVGATLNRATLTAADLTGADLTRARLIDARLVRANMSRVTMVETVLAGTDLAGARVYGAAVWNVIGVPSAQNNLKISAWNEPQITVDDLKVAQFIHLLVSNSEIRDVIDTVARKAVLILGRFTPERKGILDALRVALREHDYAPILFDFEKPASRDLTETVRTLAHLSRFIIADLTDPSSIPQELQAIVPGLAVPVVPTLSGDTPYAMFGDLQRKYHWVLDIHRYDDQEDLLNSLADGVIRPAEAKAQELSS